MPADPDVVADPYGQRAHDPFGPLVGQQGVVYGVDAYVGADQHAVADRYGRLVEDREVEVPDKAVADADLRSEIAVERAVERAPFAQVAEKLAQNRLTLLAAARRQLVEPEAELLGPVQLRADRRTDGMQPAAGLHSFEFVHGILF